MVEHNDESFRSHADVQLSPVSPRMIVLVEMEAASARRSITVATEAEEHVQ
tara:strand:- start:1765 stop:1917 length:153 start_codon:yes stop_codon:yes gene_type:complete